MRALFVIRDVVTTVDPDSGAEVKTPAVPVSWDVQYEHGGWSTIWPHKRAMFPGRIIHAYLAGEDGASGGWVVVAKTAILVMLTELLPPGDVWTASELRADSGAKATAFKAALRDERPLDDNGDPLPVEPFALYRTVFGFDHPDTLETTT